VSRVAALAGWMVAWVAAFGVAGTAPLAAQLEPVGAPGGVLRFDIRGSWASADRRMGDAGTEDYLADYGAPAFGSNRIPLLAPADTLLAAILQQPGYALNLGRVRSRGQLTIGTGTIGAALGITRRLTLFANVPFVTARVQANLKIDTTAADAGFNPAHPIYGSAAGQAQAGTFFQNFSDALTALDQRIQQGFGGDATDSLQAVALLNEGILLRNQLEAVTSASGTASPFLPTEASAAGQAIAQRITALQAGFQGYNVAFTGTPILAGPRLVRDDLNAFLSNPAGPMQAFPILESKISRMGDMDVGAVYTLIDRFDRPGTTGGLRFAVQGLLRLPTGQRDNVNNLVDVGTGNGRYEVGAAGTLDFGRGNLGARVSGGYLMRLEAFRVRRVAPPDQPYAEIARLANVRLDAGDVVHAEARPFFRLARNLAVHGVIGYLQSGRDEARYDRPQDSLPGIPASLLGSREGSTAWTLGGGITYVGRAARECEPGRRCGFPIEASWHYGTVVSASGAPVPKYRTTRVEIRWYQRLWR
jgi:hypothetical protein